MYEQFLQSPNNQSLAENATLQYVTTLKSINQNIPHHLEDQNKNIVKKKSEKIVSAIEGSSAIAVIVETTLQFISHGGAYLPGLDSFIIDKVATLPVVSLILSELSLYSLTSHRIILCISTITTRSRKSDLAGTKGIFSSRLKS